MNLSGGIWIYQHGFTLAHTGYSAPALFPWRRRRIMEYTADPRNPMTFLINGEYIRPDRHGHTDGLSVPGTCQVIVPSTLHLPSAILHDSACREHCLYAADEFRSEYIKTPITYQHAAFLLGAGLHAAGFPKRAQIVYHAVLWFGPKW